MTRWLQKGEVAKKYVERVAEPLGVLDQFVVRTALACSEKVTGVRHEGSPPQPREIVVFNEYLYFFMHLVLREAFERRESMPFVVET